jgi:hypothetical protein
MSISSLEIPLTYYNISAFNSNNTFTIQELSGNDISGPLYPIILENGLYDARFNNDESFPKHIAFSIREEITEKLIARSIKLNFDLEDKTGRSYFQVTDISKSYKINFDIDNSNNYNNYNIKYNCIENYLHQKLGWLLGFTKPSLIVSRTTGNIYSDRICQINYPRYVYIAIDDFQASSRNYFSVAAQSLIAPNIIGRINILSLLQEKTAFKQAASAGDFLFTQKHIREYFGPTDITKLRIQLLDEYGRPFNLNNADWSFVATFECFYN